MLDAIRVHVKPEPLLPREGLGHCAEACYFSFDGGKDRRGVPKFRRIWDVEIMRGGFLEEKKLRNDADDTTTQQIMINVILNVIMIFPTRL